MKSVLPAEARLAWLEVFGEPTRDESWPVGRASVRGVHFSDPGEMRAELDVVVQQEGELLIVERGALPDATTGTTVRCGDRLLELKDGPVRISDDAWELWTVFSEPAP